MVEGWVVDGSVDGVVVDGSVVDGVVDGAVVVGSVVDGVVVDGVVVDGAVDGSVVVAGGVAVSVAVSFVPGIRNITAKMMITTATTRPITVFRFMQTPPKCGFHLETWSAAWGFQCGKPMHDKLERSTAHAPIIFLVRQRSLRNTECAGFVRKQRRGQLA
ncbi:hypothetical protein BKP54_27530 [Ensifer sp. 1H6]|nr:hypothetical protein BKP54_27530 [Ensifer sp. 1H6]